MSVGGKHRMDINELHELIPFLHKGMWGLVIVLLGLVRIPKIELNFWSILARSLGRVANAEIMEKVDNLAKEFDAHVKKVDENYARQLRQRILLFSDEVLYEKGHSKEHYDDILTDIDKYENYCNTHPGFKNNKAGMAIQTIKDAYQECKDEHSFLEYPKHKKKGGEQE